MMKLNRYAMLFCLLTATSGVVQAETVKIPVGQQGADQQDVKEPRRGITMDAVEAEFGAPLARSQPVGEPPITYWEYQQYFVYFEKDRVLDTVLKRSDENR